MTLRQAVIGVLGHVDHGKTKLLDKIRGTATQIGEAGGITQAIGASIIPLDTIKKICGPLLGGKTEFTIPGLLFIDTPGHAAFTTLRKRGGNIADIAILVVDINEGFKPQTLESIEILKNFKTPFVVAANKIDVVPGYRQTDKNILKNLENQDPYVKEKIDTKLYEIVGKLSELGFNSERFDRLEDYTKQVAIVPVSAITGDGISELLMVLIGLAQRYLEKSLKLHVKGNAKGVVLEVKETTGLGKTLDVIIYDGILNKNDKVIIGGLDMPIKTRVKALLCPLPLKEMRDKKTQFKKMDQVTAATGVKICGPDIDNVIAGMPLQSYDKDENKVIREIQKEVQEVMIETDTSGVIVKADTIGSLEALTFLLKEKKVPVRKASIGKITKKDIADAESNYDKDPLQAVVLGFNVERDVDVKGSEKVKIITNEIIYKIIEEYEQWQTQQKKLMEAKELDTLVRPCKVQLMPNYVFRQSNPAIVGVDVIEGKVKTGIRLMKSGGKPITTVKSIQHEKENLQSVTKGKQVALSLNKIMVGRQVHEGDILLSYIPEPDFRKIKKLTKYLSEGEIQLLKDIVEIMRVDNPVWGI